MWTGIPRIRPNTDIFFRFTEDLYKPRVKIRERVRQVCRIKGAAHQSRSGGQDTIVCAAWCNQRSCLSTQVKEGQFQCMMNRWWAVVEPMLHTYRVFLLPYLLYATTSKANWASCTRGTFRPLAQLMSAASLQKVRWRQVADVDVSGRPPINRNQF